MINLALLHSYQRKKQYTTIIQFSNTLCIIVILKYDLFEKTIV
jgi:hypothetical protein